MANMIPLVKAAEFSGYWDNPDTEQDAQFSDGSKPNVRASFLAAFGPSASFTANVTSGIGSVVTPNLDRSAWLALSFPTGGHNVVSLSESRPLGFTAKSIWFTNSRFDWNSAGTGRVWVEAQ